MSGGAPMGMGASGVKKTRYRLNFGRFLMREIEILFFGMGAIAPSVPPKSATETPVICCLFYTFYVDLNKIEILFKLTQFN
jgi:hypothetical protein